MKNLLLFALMLSGVASGFAQGQVLFSNTPTDFATPADRLVYLYGEPLVGTQWGAQLYVGTTMNNLASVDGAPLPFRIPTTTAPGTWVGGSRVLPVPAETTVFLQVKVWNINYGATFEAALAAGGALAQSDVFTYTPPPNGSINTAFYMENFRAFSFSVPEPQMFTFIVLFSAGAWILRFRKRGVASL